MVRSANYHPKRKRLCRRTGCPQTRVLSAAITRLTNAEKNFARWDKDYQRERTKRLWKIGKLTATVRRRTSQAKCERNDRDHEN
jgi:hypothetical protein